MTLADIRARAYRMLGVDPTAPVFWTDAQMNRYINDAYIDVARRTNAIETRFTVTPAVGTGAYTLPDYIGPIFRVMYDGYRINPASTWEMDRIDPGWEDRSGFVSHYVIDARDDRVIRLYKKPSAKGAGEFSAEYGVVISYTNGVDTYTFDAELGTIIDFSASDKSFTFDAELGVLTNFDLDAKNIEIWAVKYPPRMTLDTESPELPAHVHIALAFDAASRALMRRGDHYNPALSEAYGALAQDHYRFLRSLVDNRAPEATEVVGTRATTTRYVVDPSDQVITVS